ncbi:MAG: amidohydrolase family protein [Chitinivibrionales bacterium]|nr:amidohydrolase family protein [Chitinivibrionales bacterium]
MSELTTAIDAYAHVGLPRFGSAREALAVFDRWNIERGVLVLGPGIPDVHALADALRVAGERVRCMGIPFGATDEQRRELAETQLTLGISGMRLMPFEVGPNRAILSMLGERGLWLYAINPHRDAAVTRSLIEWLEAYPGGRIAAPHFVEPVTLTQAAGDIGATRELLAHPRFCAILSRHGGASACPYPHNDLKPWVESIIETVGWDRLMWGSEHPVLYWRNERIDTAMNWLDGLGVMPGPHERERFLYGNARRLLFAEPAPSSGKASPPAWLDEQFDRKGTVPMLQRTTLTLPMTDYAVLLSDYLHRQADERLLRFGDYLAGQLSRRARELEGDADGR